METKTLSSAIKKIAISYILIYLHVNISVIDILPDWLGYFLIVSVLPIISEKEKSAQLLKPFGIAIGVWNIFEDVLKIAGDELNLTVISLVFSIITIYFHFQLITNIANLDIEEAKKKRLLNLRTATVLLHTVMSLALLVPTMFDIDYEIYSYFVIVMLIPQLVICFWISFELFKISKDMKEKEVELSETTEETANSVEETSDNE
ncbi:MAG: hypothetical protein E7522_07670 [Ruminococcaceae bacterium]|nr:hypothetical protein [Oscillospiraceae bacterium]